MSIQINFDKKYKLTQEREYRIEGDDLYPNINSYLKVTSAMILVSTDTIITVDKLNINSFNPDLFRGFIPSLDAHIVAISFTDVVAI